MSAPGGPALTSLWGPMVLLVMVPPVYYDLTSDGPEGSRGLKAWRGHGSCTSLHTPSSYLS